MKFRYILLLVLISTSAFSDNAFQQGIDAYHNSDYGSAADAFQTAVTQNETATAHHNLALALYQEGKVSESVWHLERACLLEPNNDQYHYKLGVLRQQLGLSTSIPKWYKIASQTLSQQTWIILLSIAIWITLATLLLPKISGSRVNLQIKALRAIGLIALGLAGTALYLNRDFAKQGIVLSETPATLHAAPASAAPQTGLARPGERGQAIDQYGEYIEIETEGGARGWIQAKRFRRVI